MKRLKNHAFEQLDAKEQRMLTLEDSLPNSVYCHLKKEMPTFPQCPLDLSSNKDKHKTNPTPATKAALDKSTQTEITMADTRSWFYFLGYPLTDRYTDPNMSFYPFYPHMQRNGWEHDAFSNGQNREYSQIYPESKSSNQHTIIPSKEIEKEKKLASQTNERERGKREERLMEYNARIEMWKRDRDTSRSDNPEAMKK